MKMTTGAVADPALIPPRASDLAGLRHKAPADDGGPFSVSRVRIANTIRSAALWTNPPSSRGASPKTLKKFCAIVVIAERQIRGQWEAREPVFEQPISGDLAALGQIAADCAETAASP